MAAPRDNLGRLPWIALQIILRYLPDLPTVFCLLEASELVRNVVLFQVSLFADIIEDNINRPVAEGGLHPDNRKLLRIFALISWRTMSGLHENNPLPRLYRSVIPALANAISMPPLAYSISQHGGSQARTCFASERLHKSIPSMVIYGMIKFAALAQQISHGCFRDCMARCLSLPLRQPHPNERPIADLSFSSRPDGIPLIPVNQGPPTYWEEQRLLRTTLRFLLFWDLKDATERGVISVNSHVDETFFSSNNVEEYWCGLPQHGSLEGGTRSRIFWSEVYQMRLFLSWVRSLNPGVPLSRDCLQSFLSDSRLSMPYCPLTPVSPGAQLSMDMTMTVGIPPVQSILIILRHHIREFDDKDVQFFTQFGFDFWDHERLKDFGLTNDILGSNHAWNTDQPGLSRNLFRLGFVWSSILPAPRWKICRRSFVEE
ncbi:uncharacterized protein N7511_006153 [Penicillium nucicola]|uniref:uncharacterized protein n=1 Tax=Penicillium nucicola TaxID=1850975 RepID=UPI0025458476|nr:uncharacterized protein N7511_006153 [Penicillium nucicola]KAJ5757459.1 hypothetical protein N7511_006153 [Penicillium nucicola]